MITIKTLKDNSAELHIKEGTPYTTYLLGIEMLIESLLNEVPTITIDYVLDDIKKIYVGDCCNKGEENEKDI